MKHLIIGGGSIGKRHLKNLFLLGERNLYCFRRVYNNDFEEEYHCKVICSEEEVIQLKPDVIYVCNPTSLHHTGFNLAQQSGSHIFMEKPFIHDEVLLNGMIQSWEKHRIFFIGFVLRYHPFLKLVKEKLNEKIIGEVFSARFEFGSYLPNWHPGEKVTDGYAGSKSLGGGVINTISHELDLMIYLFGIPDSVFAAKANPGYLGIDVEELAEAIFKYQWGYATLHLDFLQKDYDRQIRILGIEGKILWSWPENKVVIKKYGQPGETIEMKLDVNQLYLDELKDFLNIIHENKTEHPLDFNYAVTNTRWLLSMHKSAQKEVLWGKSLTDSLI